MTLVNDNDMIMELERLQAAVEKRLSVFFNEAVQHGTLLESMRYSLLAGGKRLRAVLCLAFCAAAGGDEQKTLDAACAIEMLHAYSLIHDDLPCMDNSDTRRGKPSNHIIYGQYTATLAGDALQAAAFGTLLRSPLPPDTVAAMGRTLADAAGVHGICGGQLLDMRGEGKKLSISELIEIHEMKTASLMSASARIGVLAAGGDDDQHTAAEAYAQAIGLAFQIRDDVLDMTSSAEELGKPIAADRERGKSTFAAVLGLEGCECVIREETDKAITALDGRFSDARFLVWFARMLEERKY